MVEYVAAATVRNTELLAPRDGAEDRQAIQGRSHELLIFRAGDLVGNGANIAKADLLGHPEDPSGTVDRCLPRLDNDQHGIDAASGGPAEVLDAGFQVHHEGLVLVKDQVLDKGSKQDAFRTGAPGASLLNGTENEQRNSLVAVGAGVGDVRHLGVHLEHLAVLLHLGAGSLLDEGLPLGDGDDLPAVIGGDAQGGGQTGGRVGIDGQHPASLPSHQQGQGGRQCGLADAALAGDCDFQSIEA